MAMNVSAIRHFKLDFSECREAALSEEKATMKGCRLHGKTPTRAA